MEFDGCVMLAVDACRGAETPVSNYDTSSIVGTSARFSLGSGSFGINFHQKDGR